MPGAKGWISSINNFRLSNDGTLNDDTGDYFGMELTYESAAGIGNEVQYNGNISAVKWKTIGEPADTAGMRSYRSVRILACFTWCVGRKERRACAGKRGGASFFLDFFWLLFCVKAKK